MEEEILRACRLLSFAASELDDDDDDDDNAAFAPTTRTADLPSSFPSYRSSSPPQGSAGNFPAKRPGPVAPAGPNNDDDDDDDDDVVVGGAGAGVGPVSTHTFALYPPGFALFCSRLG